LKTNWKINSENEKPKLGRIPSRPRPFFHFPLLFFSFSPAGLDAQCWAEPSTILLLHPALSLSDDDDATTSRDGAHGLLLTGDAQPNRHQAETQSTKAKLTSPLDTAATAWKDGSGEHSGGGTNSGGELGVPGDSVEEMRNQSLHQVHIITRSKNHRSI
jgi:hypothetical protein